MNDLGARTVRRYVLLTFLRWLPTGLVTPVTILLALERGLSLAEVGVVVAVQGFVVLALELPTGALADAVGRRTILIAAGVFGTASIVLIALADSFSGYLLAFALQGVWRALDSGPLEAWYVDTALSANDEADITGGLARGAMMLNIAMGTGALASGGLVALGIRVGLTPGTQQSVLLLPIITAAALTVLSVIMTAMLVCESRSSIRGQRLRRLILALRIVPGNLAGGFRLLGTSRVLLALVSVELFWGFGMVAFETLMPARLSELVGGTHEAGSLMGPVTSIGWLTAAAGSALIPLISRRIGNAPTAAALRLIQGGTVLAMGLVAGPAGLIGAYVACYSVHGASNPVHNSLLHRQASSTNRSTVLSLNSMFSQPAFSVGALVLGGIAASTSLGAAMVVAAIVLALAAPLYWPAWQQEKADRCALMADKT